MSTGVQNSRISRLAVRLGHDPAAVRSLLVVLNVVLIGFVIAALLSRCLGGMPQTASTEQALDDQSATEFATSFLPSMKVRAQPPGARIYLDGRFIGHDPAHIQGLDPGEYTVRAIHPDHDPAMRTIEMDFGQHEKLNLQLEPITGTLKVHSAPPGARVELVGQNRSAFSPATFDGLNPGSYRVRVQARNHLEQERTVQVHRDQATEYSFRLELNRRTRFGRAIHDVFSSVTGGNRREYQAPPRPREGRHQDQPASSAQNQQSTATNEAMATTQRPNRPSVRSEQETGNRELNARNEPEDPSAPGQAQQPQSHARLTEESARSGIAKLEGEHSSSPPRAVVSPQPEYPIHARRHGIEGKVKAEFAVTRSGRVTAIRVTRSEPRGVFDQSVRDALTDWRFAPGAEAHRLSRSFVFTLNDASPQSVNQSASNSRAYQRRGEPTRLISRVKPDYPRQASIKGTEGIVRFELEVLPDGSVGEVRVVNSQPRRVFDSAVRNAVSRWQFEPGNGGSWTYEGEIEFVLH